MRALGEHTMREEAIAWHLRLDGGSDRDWEGFADWLEADPRHNAVYDAVCDAALALEPTAKVARAAPGSLTPDPFPEIVCTRPGGRAKRLALSACFACMALGGWAGTGLLASDYTVRTVPGEMRTFVLSDGTRVVLNGGTEIVLDKADPRVATLKGGEVQFTVRHDAARPFTLSVGDHRIVDAGTVFDVRSSEDALRVEVAEGAVRFEDGVTRLRLKAGDTVEAARGRIVEGSRPAAEIGGWTRGRLIYRAAPLVEVAADITRTRGIAVALGSDVSGRRFTGVIQLDGDDVTLQKRVGTLVGLKVTATADGWSITR